MQAGLGRDEIGVGGTAVSVGGRVGSTAKEGPAGVEEVLFTGKTHAARTMIIIAARKNN